MTDREKGMGTAADKATAEQVARFEAFRRMMGHPERGSERAARMIESMEATAREREAERAKEREEARSGLRTESKLQTVEREQAIQDASRTLVGTSGERFIKKARDPARTNPNKKENEFMMNLIILRNALFSHGPAMRERAQRAGKNVWRDIRMMQATIDRIIDPLMETMPPKRDDYYRAYAAGGHYELVMNAQPIRKTRYVLAGDRELAAVLEVAMECECLLCFRTGKEIDRCPMHRLMIETIPPTVTRDEGSAMGCEYRDAAGQLVLGQDVTV